MDLTFSWIHRIQVILEGKHHENENILYKYRELIILGKPAKPFYFLKFFILFWVYHQMSWIQIKKEKYCNIYYFLFLNVMNSLTT